MPDEPLTRTTEPAPDTSLRNVKALGIVSLLTDASSEAIYPILPLFLSSVLGTPVAVIGVIESIAEATSSLMKVFSGWLSDRVGKRRPLILVGYGLSNLMKPVLAIAGTWPAVLALRFADRFGKGIRTAPRDALIADSAPPEVRGKAFGLHRALDTLGAAIGPLVAWATLSLVDGAAGFRTVFLISAIPGTAAVIVLLFAVRERRPQQPAGTRPPLGFKHLGVPFGVFTAISAVFALGNSSDAMLILRAKDLGTATAIVPLMYFLFNIVGALVATPAGILSDRIGRRRMLTAGFALYGVVYAGFALASQTWAPWLLFAAYGIPYAMTEGMARAFVVDLVGPDCRGTAVGSYTFVLGLAALPSSAVAGILWDTVGHSAPFVLSAALMLLSALALGIAGRMLKPLETCPGR
ncbi:MAG: MFS transporter [Actinobacteria bacterium HGW-Actinobacteria-1]|nr:MAG: MFS transporter [Actinobacteria bacterium HGW-Actinobacteria-1]